MIGGPRTSFVAAAALAAVAVEASPAAAEPVDTWELAIPDTRWEFGSSFTDGDVSLAWPLLVAPWLWRLGERYERIPGGIPGSSTSITRPVVVLVPELLVEPQVQVDDGELRAAVGGRIFAVHGTSGAHVVVEGLGVVGQDGTGGGVGIGVGWGSVVSVGYRHIWTDEADRNVIILDVRLFVLPRSQPRRTLAALGRYRGPLPP